MSRVLRFGQIRLEGANPMTFVEAVGEPLHEWTPEQEALVERVSAAIKCYLETTESLASGKYAHLPEKIPDYLASPGNLFIAVCLDGIVVRYERKTQEEPRRAVAVLPQSSSEVATMLSQNLIHIESPSAPLPPSDAFGVEMRLCVYSPSTGITQDFAACRIWFQASSSSPQSPQPPGAKPFCLLSVRSQLDVEFRGLITINDRSLPEQPFIARSTARLQVGW